VAYPAGRQTRRGGPGGRRPRPDTVPAAEAAVAPPAPPAGAEGAGGVPRAAAVGAAAAVAGALVAVRRSGGRPPSRRRTGVKPARLVGRPGLPLPVAAEAEAASAAAGRGRRARRPGSRTTRGPGWRRTRLAARGTLWRRRVVAPETRGSAPGLPVWAAWCCCGEEVGGGAYPPSTWAGEGGPLVELALTSCARVLFEWMKDVERLTFYEFDLAS
jgi:hypothetical protein